MNGEIERLLQPRNLAEDWSRKSWNHAGTILDQQGSTPVGTANLIRDSSFYQDCRERISKGFDSAYTAGSMTVLAPVGIFGLMEGFAAPDWDITTLGIGYHRYFLFHSAIGLAVLRHFHQKWHESLQQNSSWNSRAKRKVIGALLGATAAGVGIHLLVDVFQPKSIVFPFFGSLIEGTLVDDDIWLLGNSLWAFKISHDIFTLVMAEEMSVAQEFAVRQFGELAAWRP